MNSQLRESQIDPIDLFIENLYYGKKIPLKNFLNDIEIRLIIFSLMETNGNQREAAKILGIKPTTLNEKMKKHNVKIRKSVTLLNES